jgi:16S rRNA (uracil1498-N3)-methyltransferase
MTDRYFHPDLKQPGIISMLETEAQHLSKVKRAELGDHVELFDGQGRLAVGVIATISRKAVTVEVQGISAAVPISPVTKTLAVAPPKGDRLTSLVEKATELGIDRLILLQTDRTIVTPGEQKRERLNQVVISACKQSLRLRLMEISEITPLKKWLPKLQPAQQLYLADPNGESWLNQSTDCHKQQPTTAITEHIACIGPEGGFTAEEITLFTQHSAKKVAIAPHILRIETAALAMATLLINAAPTEPRT